ncbi:MAG: hypothetical protein CMH80_06195 [Nitrospinae bacterium]|jgi:hypothetical protein|nr:hypothetical protein [Nitrospinota bacterium]
MKPGSPKLVGYSGFPVEEPFFYVSKRQNSSNPNPFFVAHEHEINGELNAGAWSDMDVLDYYVLTK